MAEYQSLRTLFHRTTSDADAAVQTELQKRLASPATLRYPYQVRENALFVVLHRGIQELCEAVLCQELSIQRLWNQLPLVAQSHYFFTLLVNEIQSTNEIENIHSTRQEVTEALEAAGRKNQTSGNQPPKRFLEMADTFRLLFEYAAPGQHRFPQSLPGVRKLYDRLLEGEIALDEQPDGKLFRSEPVSIWEGTHQPIHTGARTEAEINARLGVMLEVSAAGNNNLVNAFVAHFMVEHTHPFYDGNGRFGRFLLALQLQEVLSAPTALSLSSEIMRQKRKYYRAFEQVEHPLNQAEATFFVADMLQILLDAQSDLEESLRERLGSLGRLEEAIQRLRSGGGLGEYQIGALHFLGQVSLFGPRSGARLDEIADFLERSRGTVRPELKALVDRGLVREISRKPLVFALNTAGRELLGLSRMPA